MCVCMYVLYLLYRGEDEYLIALDDTRWLYRVQELLQTAAAVVTKLEEEHASVLVSYDSGRDRTGQVSMIVVIVSQASTTYTANSSTIPKTKSTTI